MVWVTNPIYWHVFCPQFWWELGSGVCVCVYTWSRNKFLSVIPFHLSFRCTVFQDLITMINAWKYWNERQGSERVYLLAAIRRALTIHMSMIYSFKGHIIFILYWILDIRGSQILGDLVCQHLIFLLKFSFFPLYIQECVSVLLHQVIGS